MVDTFLVPPRTVVEEKGASHAVEVGGAANRVFLLNLEITNIVEQESLDLSIYSSADGATWGPKPRATFPQKFYRGPHPLLLDLTALPEIKFIRAHWEVNRWGRGSEPPMFELQVAIKEVPPEILKEATAEAQALAYIQLVPTVPRHTDSPAFTIKTQLMDSSSRVIVRPARNIAGQVTLPGDKSISH